MRLLRAIVVLAAAGSAACALMSAYSFDGYGPADGDAAADGSALADGATDGTIPNDALGQDAPGADAPEGDAGTDAPPADCGADLTTSKTNCGRCGHDCLGGDCDAGVCQPTTLYQQAFPQGVATTATDVYWTQWATNGPIFKARKDGADAGPISPPQNSAAWIGLGSTEIYWTTQDAIFRCPFADCSNPQPFAGVTPADGAQDLLVGSRVMWSLDGIAANGAIVVTPEAMLDAGPVVGGLNSPCGVAMDASRIYWTEQGTGAANFIDGVVKSANLDGSNVMVIATGQNNPKRIAVDDKNVYFTTRNTVADAGTVAMCPIGTPCGATPTVLAYNQDRPTAIVVDSTSIYWSNQGDGTGLNGSLMRCAKPICASGPQTIVAHAYSLSLAQDATAIYWANWLPTGSVMRLAK